MILKARGRSLIFQDSRQEMVELLKTAISILPQDLLFILLVQRIGHCHRTPHRCLIIGPTHIYIHHARYGSTVGIMMNSEEVDRYMFKRICIACVHCLLIQ